MLKKSNVRFIAIQNLDIETIDKNIIVTHNVLVVCAAYGWVATNIVYALTNKAKFIQLAFKF